nr:MAG TPA: hypothetical protein [Caudoviricetes sp.]
MQHGPKSLLGFVIFAGLLSFGPVIMSLTDYQYANLKRASGQLHLM